MKPNLPPLKTGNTYPSNVLRDDYGFNAENRPIIVVDPSEVPENFIQLIPYVERWGIPCDVTRGDYFDSQPDEDIAKFYYTILPFQDAINMWLDSLDEDVLQWSEAGVQFMYMLKAHCEAYQPTKDELEAQERRFSEMQEQRQRKRDINEAMTHFKSKKYASVVKLLSKYDGSLSKIESTKLNYARKNQKG